MEDKITLVLSRFEITLLKDSVDLGLGLIGGTNIPKSQQLEKELLKLQEKLESSLS